MGDVLVKFSIMPDDMKHFEALKEDVSKSISAIKKVKQFNLLEQDIAFGMKAIILNVVLPDDSGGADLIEQELNKLKHLSSLEVKEMDRI